MLCLYDIPKCDETFKINPDYVIWMTGIVKILTLRNK